MKDEQKAYRKVLQRRRLVVSCVALLLIVVLAFALVKISMSIMQSITTHMSKSNDKFETLEQVDDIPDTDCTADALKIEASLSAPSFSVATGVHVNVRTINLGNVACKISTVSPTRVFAVTSGSDTVYISAGCPTPDAGVALLRGESDTADLSWNLHRLGGDACATGEVVKPGWYTMQVFYPSMPSVSASIGFQVE